MGRGRAGIGQHWSCCCVHARIRVSLPKRRRLWCRRPLRTHRVLQFPRWRVRIRLALRRSLGDRFAGECVDQVIPDPVPMGSEEGTAAVTSGSSGTSGPGPGSEATTIVLGDSSSSTGGALDEGTTSSTTTGLPSECNMPGDCEQCAGMSCCDEVLQCYMSTECTCVLDCFLPGGDPVQCFAMCGAPPEAIPLQNCTEANCNAECVP